MKTKVRLEEDYPEYSGGPRGGDILEVTSITEEGYNCLFQGSNFFVYEYEIEEEIEEADD